MADPQIKIINTLKAGVTWANELKTHMAETPVGGWDEKKAIIACLVYSAAMAQDTELDEESFLDLAAISFRGVVRE